MAPAGAVVHEREVEAARLGDDTASVRTTLDARHGCRRLEQRVVRFAPGRSQPTVVEGGPHVLYVASGTGSLLVDGRPHLLEPDVGAWAASGERYEVDNPGPDDLVAVVVAVGEEAPADAPRRVTVRAADQPVQRTGDREFRIVVDPAAGCGSVTQFVGDIPPGRAPAHSHTYDEVVYVLRGEGVVHLEGDDAPVSAGSCVYLPPPLQHCLENTGTGVLRVLGVFCPAGDPGSKVVPARQ